ncbi:DUF418 domain-containing protein [Flavihumibacter rivuli]|uniref:DUF418 domain-containing protein n=1 Tax=Flavihumibacter rivuli TaxID=2838156 RepID=UPI001BDE5E59|nr:DUF418 domain-containing protein [Flavihumibacter rivuli]ULQ55485.1 DUF418 domain-containing protein [Flavihumibacter rivuli]
MEANPIPSQQRADILDVLRGFALFGVLMDNLFGFTGWGFLTDTDRQSLPTWPADGALALLEFTFINGKFFSLFSLLFGIGFAIQFLGNEKKGLDAHRIFYRRLFILLIIGILHLRFLWDGDILTLYAVLGFFLPLFRNWPDRKLLILSAALVLSPIIFDIFSIAFHYKNGAYFEMLAREVDKRTGLPTTDAYAKYLYNDGAGWAEWSNWKASGYLYRIAYLLDTNRLPKVFGMFILGFYAGRKMIHLHLESYTRIFRLLRKWGLIIGIPAAFCCTYFEIFQPHIPNPVGLAHTVFFALSVVPLCLAYTSIVCLHWIKHKDTSILRFLAPMGRMALTNYLMQTVLGISIFYGVGLGLGGNIGPSLYLPIGLLIYLFQVIFSNWWFSRFNFGPMEWIWRQLTYGKKIPLRKAVSF